MRRVILRRVWAWMKKEVLSIVTIILLVVYIFISYKTYLVEQKRYEIAQEIYLIEQKRYEVACLTRELMLRIDEMIQKLCASRNWEGR